MYCTLDINRKGRHIIGHYTLKDYINMLNEFEMDGNHFKIIKEVFYSRGDGEEMVSFHIVRFTG